MDKTIAGEDGDDDLEIGNYAVNFTRRGGENWNFHIQWWSWKIFSHATLSQDQCTEEKKMQWHLNWSDILIILCQSTLGFSETSWCLIGIAGMTQFAIIVVRCIRLEFAEFLPSFSIPRFGFPHPKPPKNSQGQRDYTREKICDQLQKLECTEFAAN